MSYSVLMSVYYKESPCYFEQSLSSIYNQTVQTDDFVLVCDGPLNEDLDTVIEKYKKLFGSILNVVRLDSNIGLGRALNRGLSFCKNELIARMDSDDISFPNRCQRQLDVFENNPDIAVCSGTVLNFSVSTDVIDSKRELPQFNQNIVNFSKSRNPFNHPCVMFKKSAVLEAGSYQDFYLLEDYYLWIRMFMRGSIGYNIPQPLLYMRSDVSMFKRRSGFKYLKSQIKLFKYMRENKYISNVIFVRSCLSRTVASMLPNRLRMFFYNIIVRDKYE